MLNWDDPIAKFKPAAATPAPVERHARAMAATEALAQFERQEVQVEARVEHSVMRSVSAPAAQETATDDVDHGATGLEQVEFGARRLAVDDKKNDQLPRRFESARAV